MTTLWALTPGWETTLEGINLVISANLDQTVWILS